MTNIETEYFNCSKCGGKMRPTGSMVDTFPALINFRCETCLNVIAVCEDEIKYEELF